jgi:hypothetical protein
MNEMNEMNEIYERYIIILTDLLDKDIIDSYLLTNRINNIINDSRYHISNELLDDYYDEIIISKLYSNDMIHIDSEKEDNTYYIGDVYKNRLKHDEPILIHTSISPRFLLKYKFETISFFLENMEYMEQHYNSLYKNIEIFKTAPDYVETGSIILKTYWLKIIQRVWKKIYKKRIEWQKKSMHPIALRHREINGRNMYGHAPTMRGMLSYLQQ